MLLRDDRMENTIYRSHFSEIQTKKKTFLKPPFFLNLPKVGDLIFKTNTKPLFDFLKLVLLLVRDRAHAIGPTNSERSLKIRPHFPTDFFCVGIQDRTHWFDEQRGFVLEWGDARKQTKGFSFRLVCVTHGWNGVVTQGQTYRTNEKVILTNWIH